MNNPYEYILPDQELSAKAIKAKILSFFDNEKSFTAASEEIAKRMNVETRTVIKWCTIAPPAKLDTLILLSYILNCDIKELYVCKSQYAHPGFSDNDVNTDDITGVDTESTLYIKRKDQKNKKYHIKNLQSLLRYIYYCDRGVLEDVLYRVSDYNSPVVDDYILTQMARIREGVPKRIRDYIDNDLYYNYSLPCIRHELFKDEEIRKEGDKFIEEHKWETTEELKQMHNIKKANYMYEEDCYGLRLLYLKLIERRPNIVKRYDIIFLKEFKLEIKRMINNIEDKININLEELCLGQ